MTYLLTQMALCLLIAFLLGLLLGWWLGRRTLEKRIEELDASWQRRLDQCREEEAQSRAALKGCQSELESSRSELESCRSDLKSCQESLESCREELNTASAAAPGTLPQMAGGAEASEEPDDLTRIEGIGPKIEGLLNAQGITTWARLADTDVASLQSVLDEAGPRYRIHDPGTWPKQARLASEGAWDELEELQDRLKGGRES